MESVRVCPLCRLPHNSAIRCREYKRALATIDQASVLQLQQALEELEARKSDSKQPEVNNGPI